MAVKDSYDIGFASGQASKAGRIAELEQQVAALRAALTDAANHIDNELCGDPDTRDRAETIYNGAIAALEASND